MVLETNWPPLSVFPGGKALLVGDSGIQSLGTELKIANRHGAFKYLPQARSDQLNRDTVGEGMNAAK